MKLKVVGRAVGLTAMQRPAAGLFRLGVPPLLPGFTPLRMRSRRKIKTAAIHRRFDGGDSSPMARLALKCFAKAAMNR
ncbi:hypothetical protein, partial [Haloferula sp. A504]|uniref:hypothetical protein n=1 Tax=Haloferula sp. A504 TaxID=3373601 RepID=UPI0031CBA22D|nr:hypothetical protein [Verrucomicrobiaceae bacterium E54]